MKGIVSILLLFIFSSVSAQTIGETMRRYFFDDQLTIDDSTALIVLVRDSQTQFARELNARIYTDTNFIKKLKETWYVEYKYEGQGRSGHLCGHDMFFYKHSGSEFTYLNNLNSNCGISEVGCTNLHVLLESGRPLRIDTLTRIRMNMYKKDIFTEDLIKGYCTNNEINWEICSTKKYPRIYYDGYFKTQIILDTTMTVNQNVENFIRLYAKKSERINWNISKNQLSEQEFTNAKKDLVNTGPREIEITFYLKMSEFELFKDFDIETIDFDIKSGSELILLYRN